MCGSTLVLITADASFALTSDSSRRSSSTCPTSLSSDGFYLTSESCPLSLGFLNAKVMSQLRTERWLTLSTITSPQMGKKSQTIRFILQLLVVTELLCVLQKALVTSRSSCSHANQLNKIHLPFFFLVSLSVAPYSWAVVFFPKWILNFPFSHSDFGVNHVKTLVIVNSFLKFSLSDL